MENKEIERPLSLIIITAILGLLSLLGLSGAVFRGEFSDPRLIAFILIFSSVIAVWKMKRFGMWALYFSFMFFAAMMTYDTDRPLRDFLYYGGPPLLAIVACTYPHRERMS